MVHCIKGKWGQFQRGNKAQYGFLFKSQKGMNGKVSTRQMTEEEKNKYANYLPINLTKNIV